METTILIALALLIAYILVDRTSKKKSLKSLKIMTTGQIWDFKERKNMKNILIALTLIIFSSSALFLKVHEAYL